MGLYTGHDPLSWVKQLIGDKDERKPWRASSWSNAPLSSSPSPEEPVQAEPKKAPANDQASAVPTPSSFAPKPGGLLDEVGPGPGDGSDPDGGPSPSMSMADAVGRGGMSALEAGARGVSHLTSVFSNPISPFVSTHEHGKAFAEAAKGKANLAQAEQGPFSFAPIDAEISGTSLSPSAPEPENATPTIGPPSGAAHGPSGHGAGSGKGAGSNATAAGKGASHGLGALSVGDGGGGGSSTGSVSPPSGSSGPMGLAAVDPMGGMVGVSGPGHGGGGSSGGVSAMGPSAGAAHGPSGHGAGAGGGGGGGK